jgi:uncharacterized protein (TIGR04255 family)
MSKSFKSDKYRNPPLVEMFCECFFQSPDSKEWDEFLVPDFYKKLDSEYPHRKQLHPVGMFSQGDDSRVAGAPSSLNAPTPRFLFSSKDRKSFVQVGENVLVLNQLPTPGVFWKDFESQVVKCFKTYALLWKPKLLTKVALHYIDRVDIPTDEFQLEDYFNLYPLLPSSINKPVMNLAMEFEVEGVSPGDVMSVAFRQYPSAGPQSSSFQFQWDYVATPQVAPPDPGEIRSWLGAAHRFSVDLFHSAVTPKCKELFTPLRDGPDEPAD